MGEKSERLGERYITNEGYEVIIKNYRGCMDVDVIFESGYILNTTYNSIKIGTISNPYHPTICNIGYFGVGRFKSKIKGVRNKQYQIWINMIKRCYSTKQIERNLTYKDVTVCEEWHNFQNFAEWYEENYNPEYMEGWHLDKDILVKGNKVYSPETCTLVPKEINNLFKKYNIINKIYPTGVVYHSRDKKFYISFVKKGHTCSFPSVEEAFQAYKTAKEKHIKEVADKWKDLITKQTYQAMYNYKVEITD